MQGLGAVSYTVPCGWCLWVSIHDSAGPTEKKLKSTQKQQKLIRESNQVLEFYRHGRLSVVLINPVPRVFQCPFSMLCCAVAVRGSEVDLCRVPAEICARFGVTHRLRSIFLTVNSDQDGAAKSDNLLEKCH